MSDTSTPAPIIVIRRKKARHGGHHGGAWKVAYADFVTAMMALFIVLWLLSSDEKVKKAVGGYFQDPTGNGNLAGSTLAGAGEGIVVSRENMDQLKEQLEQAMRLVPKFEEILQNVELLVTNEGLRIELLENEGGLFFENGNAKPSAKGHELIFMLGERLKALPNKLLIEGHTDAKPYTSDTGYTNWELSADRANSARRLIQEAGVPPGRIAQIRGFADQHLRDPKTPFNPANRRISVLVQYQQQSPQAAGPARGDARRAAAPPPAPPTHGASH